MPSWRGIDKTVLNALFLKILFKNSTPGLVSPKQEKAIRGSDPRTTLPRVFLPLFQNSFILKCRNLLIFIPNRRNISVNQYI